MFPKFCGIKYLWTIDRTKAIFFQRGHKFDRILHWMSQWGKIWNALILVDNNVFVLQATQSINSQIWRHHVFRFTFYNMSNFMFSERTYFDGTPTSKIWLCGTEKLKGQLQSFYPICLELGWEFINKYHLSFFSFNFRVIKVNSERTFFDGI